MNDQNKNGNNTQMNDQNENGNCEMSTYSDEEL